MISGPDFVKGPEPTFAGGDHCQCVFERSRVDRATPALAICVSTKSTCRLTSTNLSVDRSKRFGVRTALWYIKPNNMRCHAGSRGRVLLGTTSSRAAKNTASSRSTGQPWSLALAQREREVGHLNKTEAHVYVPKPIGDVLGSRSNCRGYARHLVETHCQSDNSGCMLSNWAT